jgi:hypothetical protein
MTNPNELFPSFPVDVRALWDVNGKSFDYADKAYRAWLDAAGEMQSQAIAFLHDRLTKDSAAVTRLGQCRTPVEVLSVQAEYAGNMFADLISESQKIAAYLGKAATISARGGAAHGQRQTEHKRPAHRPSTH